MTKEQPGELVVYPECTILFTIHTKMFFDTLLVTLKATQVLTTHSTLSITLVPASSYFLHFQLKSHYSSFKRD